MTAMQLVDLVTLVSALKISLPRLPPAAPATLGASLVMTSGGVMAGSQLVVSAEWVEMIRRLLQAGVISLPAVSAAVRIQGGQVMMAQASGELPEGLRTRRAGRQPRGSRHEGDRQSGGGHVRASEAPRHAARAARMVRAAWLQRRHR